MIYGINKSYHRENRTRHCDMLIDISYFLISEMRICLLSKMLHHEKKLKRIKCIFSCGSVNQFSCISWTGAPLYNLLEMCHNRRGGLRCDLLRIPEAYLFGAERRHTPPSTRRTSATGSDHTNQRKKYKGIV